MRWEQEKVARVGEGISEGACVRVVCMKGEVFRVCVCVCDVCVCKSSGNISFTKCV